jgi:hypothetical protein
MLGPFPSEDSSESSKGAVIRKKSRREELTGYKQPDVNGLLLQAGKVESVGSAIIRRVHTHGTGMAAFP